MLTLVVTGGIGSGKSEVCHYLETKGIPVYDSDSRAKSLYDSDRELVERISAALGCRISDDSGKVDRKALASVIFSDSRRLEALESVVHPRVLEDFIAWRDAHSGADIVVMESAIFLQKPLFHPYVDKVVLVDAPIEMRVMRACRRDNADEQKIRARMAAQTFDTAAADYLIINDSGLDVLHERTDMVLKEIVKQEKQKNMKTNLARILSVSGQHGLFTFIAQARNGIIAEALSTKKRTALDAHSRVNTLADISIYTSEGEMKLQDVFLALKEALGDAQAPTSKASADELKALFAKAVPTYDEDRFYVSHMKKVIDWYNEIVSFASLDFVTEGEEEEVAEEEA
ncbi:MAG: dephospho-CoA kinase [Bacteroidales bacterium]|nr:dephospho-CoA kinase [Candidatus Cryptobacteroides onthequi]